MDKIEQLKAELEKRIDHLEGVINGYGKGIQDGLKQALALINSLEEPVGTTVKSTMSDDKEAL